VLPSFDGKVLFPKGNPHSRNLSCVPENSDHGRLDDQKVALSSTRQDLQRLAEVVIFRCVEKGVVALFRDYTSTSVLDGR
jgi:hypothetical protein